MMTTIATNPPEVVLSNTEVEEASEAEVVAELKQIMPLAIDQLVNYVEIMVLWLWSVNIGLMRTLSQLLRRITTLLNLRKSRRIKHLAPHKPQLF